MEIPLPPAIIVVACLNLLVLGAFAYDKYKAKNGRWRTPECTLLILAFLSPFGALAGMMVFRHKTRHTKFLLVPLFAIVQVTLALYLFTPLFH